MGIRSAVDAFVICQSQKVPLSPGQGEILKLYCLLSKYPNKIKMNQRRI